MGTRVIEFKALFWSVEEDLNEPDTGTEIHVTGLTEKQESVYCRIVGFRPYVYFQLTKRVAWNKHRAKILYDYIHDVICKQNGKPVAMECVKKKLLRGEKEWCMLKLYFPSMVAIRQFCRKLSYSKTGFYIEDLDLQLRKDELLIHEQNFDPIIKMTAINNLEDAGWIRAVEYIPREERSLSVEDRAFSTCDIDLYAKYNDLTPITKETMLMHYKYVNFDIETYSKNHNAKLPDPKIPENVIFQIGVSVSRLGYDRNKRKRILFTLFDPHDIPNVEVRRFDTEKSLLLDFFKMISTENPDIFVGYNIMKFDWHYIVERSEILGIVKQMFKISRLLCIPARLETTKWHSSAYGDQEFKYVFCPGRLNIDLILEIERNYKLPKYNLNTVAQHFLKESKDDVTPRQLFMLYKLSQDMLSRVKSLEYDYIPRHERVELKMEIIKILPKRMCHGVVSTLRNEIMNAKTKSEFVRIIRDGLTITGRYCIQDVEVTENLEEKLNLEQTMEAMSNCMCVPMSYLHTRGQQVRAQGQFYRETVNNNIVIPYHKVGPDFVKKKYQGAIVLRCKQGFHKHVAIFDFASLYPSSLMDNNMCYTTLVEDESIPDSECHVLEWDEHIACEHDPQKRKAKKDGSNVLCGHHRYRFLRIIFLPDGTRLREGIMPKLEKRLLSKRKSIKKELAELEAKYRMAVGLAESKDIEYYKEQGWQIIKKGSLSDNEVTILQVGITVLNAYQLGVKMTANSIYGITGSQMGFAPLVEAASSITYYGRHMITSVMNFINKREKGSTIVYGDTDSVMVKFEGKGTMETFEYGDVLSRKITHYLKSKSIGVKENYSIRHPITGELMRLDKFPRKDMHLLSDKHKVNIYKYDYCPMDLQFENLYDKKLLLTKKRYVAYAVNRKGETISNVKKGCVMSRRDNCAYLRDGYSEIIKSVLDEKGEDHTLDIIYNHVHKLFTRQIPDVKLIIYMGVKDLKGYAVKKKNSNKNIDKDGNELDDNLDPLDDRLVYRKIPQALLLRKMIKRGEIISSGTRLEFIYLEDEKAIAQGDKAEDYTYYRENRLDNNFRPDYIHYVEKQLECPFTELLNVSYQHGIIPYEKIEDKVKRLINDANDITRDVINSCKKDMRKGYIKTSIPARSRVGWKNMCKKCKKHDCDCIEIFVKSKCKKCEKYPMYGKDKYLGTHCEKHKKDNMKLVNDRKGQLERVYKVKHANNIKSSREYLFKNFEAQVQFIIDSAKRNSGPVKDISEINPIDCSELVDACKTWKSRNIIDKLYKQYGLKKRTSKRPTQTGAKIKVMVGGEATKVVLTNKISKYPVNTQAELIDIHETKIPTKIKKNSIEYSYDIKMPDGNIITEVPRKSITTFRYRDSTVLKDMRQYRAFYKAVVKEMNNRNDKQLLDFGE